MSASVTYDLPMPCREAYSGGLDRRHFLMGMGVIGSALGVGAQYGPRWGEDAPSRQAARPSGNGPPPPSPRAVQHGPLMRQEWLAFRTRFVTAEGRVIDTGNANASHSEGQGWGLMAAQAADDAPAFETILGWTKANLQRRPGDALHAWRYRPSDPNPVSDLNNATDGDLFIAAALARGAVRWNRPDYAVAAAAIARDILGLVRQAGLRTLLLPGVNGFEKPDAYTLNPSYYAFALFPDLEALAPSPLWEALRQDGVQLMLQARFGRWSLPPDWLRVDRRSGALSEAPGWPPRFSYDAIRVPLHLAWAGLPAAPLLDSFRQYWTANGGAQAMSVPAWVDLRTQATAPYAAPAGFYAVAAVALRAPSGSPAVASLPIPPMAAAKDYYSAGLVLLSLMAAGQSGLVA